ncbi:Uncharacterised protein [Photobacterium damselae]|nr:Uncharacterised protein [Photobacterium damselae]
MGDSLFYGRRFRTFNLIGDFNREVLAIKIDLNLPVLRIIQVLERVIAWRGYPNWIIVQSLFLVRLLSELNDLTLWEFLTLYSTTENSN